MAYVRKTLSPGERYVFRARFNWTYDLSSLFWLFVGLIPTIFRTLEAVGLTPETSRSFGPAFNGFAIGSGVLGGLICLTRYVHKWTTVVAVTTARLIFKRGLISRITAEMTLDKIEEIVLHQTFLGRILGYGHLTVRGTGVSEIEFPDLANPIGFRRNIEESMVEAKSA